MAARQTPTQRAEIDVTIAHELRQPLTAIRLNAESALRLTGQPERNLSDIREALTDIIEATERATEVIGRNRRLLRDHTIDAQPLDINGVIRETLVLARASLYESAVTVQTSLAADVPAVLGDRIELQQVLLNLLTNAVDAMRPLPSGSRVLRISSTAVDADTVTVAVSDNGVGLDEADLQKIFSLAYTTKANGTGVGLAISRSIVDAHGGRLWAEPNPGAGATFAFTLPTGRQKGSGIFSARP
jgi:signal transduction histidine kinase